MAELDQSDPGCRSVLGCKQGLIMQLLRVAACLPGLLA